MKWLLCSWSSWFSAFYGRREYTIGVLLCRVVCPQWYYSFFVYHRLVLLAVRVEWHMPPTRRRWEMPTTTVTHWPNTDDAIRVLPVVPFYTCGDPMCVCSLVWHYWIEEAMTHTIYVSHSNSRYCTGLQLCLCWRLLFTLALAWN